MGTGEHRWNPGSREDADQSISYVVAAALIDGTVTLRSFNAAHLWNPELRALMQKIDVVENAEFTKTFERLPVEYRAWITVVTANGEWLAGESGGDQDDLATPRSNAQIEEKFRGLTEDILSVKQVNTTLARL